MAESKRKAHKVGDEVDVPKGAEFVSGPDGSVASVRTGGTYRFTAPGEYVIGKPRARVGGIVGATFTVEK